MPKIVDHEQRRQEIVAALWRVVAREGFNAVSVRSVAAEAGLNPTTVALAFTSRTELLIEAYADLSGRDDARLTKLTKPGMSIEVLVDACLLAVPLTSARVQHAGVWIALVSAAGHDPAAAAALAEFSAGLSERIHDFIDRAVTEGVLRPTVDVATQALLVHAILDGFSVQVIGSGQPKRAAIKAALTEHFRSLAA